jgi:predicted Zn-dependent peptidase
MLQYQFLQLAAARRRLPALKFVSLSLVMAVCCSAGARPVREPFGAVQTATQEFTIANGMRFVVVQRTGVPVVSLAVCVDIGFADDPKGRSGLAHLIEHVAFKGTNLIGTTNPEMEHKALARSDVLQRQLRLAGSESGARDLKRRFEEAEDAAGKFASSSDFARLFETAGGVRLTARTNADETVFSVDLPANKVELWFLLESERFRGSVFREFYKEKEVVIDERRMRVDTNDRGRLMEDLLHVAFDTHPYGIPGLGIPSELRALSREDAVEFFRTYYNPANLVAVLVGDIDPSVARQLAVKYFGRLPAGKPRDERVNIDGQPETERWVVLRRNGPRRVALAYHKSMLAQKKKAAFDLLCTVLAQDRTSRLHQKLAIDKPLITSVQFNGYYPGGRDPGLLLLEATLTAETSAAEVVGAIRSELRWLTLHSVEQQTLATAKKRLTLTWASTLDRNSSAAYALAVWSAQSGTCNDLWEYFEDLQAVSPDELREVAASLFTSDTPVVGIIENGQGVAQRSVGGLQ